MPNTARVEANVAYVNSLAGRKGAGGVATPPKVPPVSPNPKAPEQPVDPQDDVPPPPNWDYSILDPNLKAQIPSIFEKGLPHEPPPAGTFKIGELVGKTPQPGRAGTAALLGTIPGNILTGSQTVWAKYDPNSIDVAYQGGVWQSFVGNVTMDIQASLETYANAMLADPAFTDTLLNYLYGGQYINGGINMTSLQWYLRTDLTSRAINNVWSSYMTYVASTNLNDPPYGNWTPACNAHTVGPQETKFCGNGGGFYLYNLCTTDYKRDGRKPPGMQQGLAETTQVSYPGQCSPFGLDKFEAEGRLNITSSGTTEGSARAWNATGSVSISTSDDEAMTASTVGLFSNSAIEDLPSMVGRLPGEWSLPVCDQGKNTWGGDYTNNGDPGQGTSIGYLPCACGWQGNTTAANIINEDLYELAFNSCEGALLFPKAGSVTPKTGNGAHDLNGGIWKGNSYYGKFTAETWHNQDLYCSDKGKLFMP